MYIPDGYGTVFPYIIVDDAGRFVDFLEAALGAEELGRTVLPDGRIANVRVRIGTSSFMVSEASEKMPAMPAAYYIYVEDAGRAFESAVSAGATRMFDPIDMPYLDRQAGVTDPFGNIWWISERLVDSGYDD